jgi:hypothetical protein
MLNRLTPLRLAASCAVLFCLVVGAVVCIRSLTGTTTRAAPEPSPGRSSHTSTAEQDNTPTWTATPGGTTPSLNFSGDIVGTPNGCGDIFFVPYSVPDVRRITTAGKDVTQYPGSVLVNGAVSLEVDPARQGGTLPRISNVTIKVGRQLPYPEHGTYVVDDTGCDQIPPGLGAYEWTSTDDLDLAATFFYARFAGSRVVTGNGSSLATTPAVAVGVQPYACGGTVIEWTARARWKAGTSTGTKVLGPFRTVPDQGLPEYALTLDAKGTYHLGAEPLNSRQAVRSCRSAPVPDPAHPTAYPQCGTVSYGGHGGVYVDVEGGTVSCATALRITGIYLDHPPQPPQGTSDYLEFSGWQCQRTTWAEAQPFGFLGSCTSAAGTIDLAAE